MLFVIIWNTKMKMEKIKLINILFPMWKSYFNVYTFKWIYILVLDY